MLLTYRLYEFRHADQVADAFEVIGQHREVHFGGDFAEPAAKKVVITEAAFDRAKDMLNDGFAAAHDLRVSFDARSHRFLHFLES